MKGEFEEVSAKMLSEARPWGLADMPWCHATWRVPLSSRQIHLF